MGETVERLLLAGTAGDEGIAELIKDVGLDAVAGVLAAEIAFRCDPPVNSRPVHVSLELTHTGESRRVLFRVVRDAPVTMVEGPGAATGDGDRSGDRDGDRPVEMSRLRLTVTDVVRRLFGPEDAHRGHGDLTNAFLATAPKDMAEMAALTPLVTEATHTIMTGLSPRRPDLDALSVRYGSDKWASFHWYTPHYDRHFAPYRERPVRVLEIGIGGYDQEAGGGSLRMWKRYFRRGLVFGLDLYDKTRLDAPRMRALVGDQGDPGTLAGIVAEHGPFDIVIDDGSHLNEHVHTSFHTLFPLLRDGGLYVIEDLQTAYWATFGGTPGPQAAPHTSVGLVKRLVDDLHYREHRWEDPERAEEPPNSVQATVVGVHAYHNVAFIEKGTNGEESLPGWLRGFGAAEE
ncbi:hypothetical protein ACFY4C_41220 [Actinomadura viridis]|uniref:hypothetical protein n=1 Tax=Actinomadura viridis TaxID=58110 RepID=UPI00369956EF